MSYQEKRIVLQVISGLALIAVYCGVAAFRFHSGALAPGDVKAWAGLQLAFIGAGILVMIVLQILFHILIAIRTSIRMTLEKGSCDEKEIERTISAAVVEDEMGKLIELKGSKFGYAVAGAGAGIEGIAELGYYRKGL